MHIETNKHYWAIQWRGIFCSFPFDILNIVGVGPKEIAYEGLIYRTTDTSNNTILFEAVISEMKELQFESNPLCLNIFKTKKEAVEFAKKTALSEIRLVRSQIINKIKALS